MSSSAPEISITSPPNSTRPSPPRRSSSMHKNLITKLRPLPFQYVWSVWHSKADTSNSDSYDAHLTLLADSVPDIGAFYRIYNNFPWQSIKPKDVVYVFRAGVRPLWEDIENLDGGCWVVKARREEGRAIALWEEMCLLVCGGELQAAISSERDHVLGLSYSPRLYWAHISVWTKKGSNRKSIELLQDTILDRISAELKPKSSVEYYYKKHSDHEGWKEAVEAGKESSEREQRIGTVEGEQQKGTVGGEQQKGTVEGEQ